MKKQKSERATRSRSVVRENDGTGVRWKQTTADEIDRTLVMMHRAGILQEKRENRKSPSGPGRPGVVVGCRSGGIMQEVPGPCCLYKAHGAFSSCCCYCYCSLQSRLPGLLAATHSVHVHGGRGCGTAPPRHPRTAPLRMYYPVWLMGRAAGSPANGR